MSISPKIAVPMIAALLFAVTFMATRDPPLPQTTAPDSGSVAVATGEVLGPVQVESHADEHEKPSVPVQQAHAPFKEVALSSHQPLDAATFDVSPPAISESVPLPVPAQGLTDPVQLAALGLNAEAVSHFQLRVDRILQEQAGLVAKSIREDAEQSYAQARLDVLQYELNRIRDHVGDDDYDRHLFASGKPNRVVVSASADAAFASGLALGDVIISYNDRRVFDAFELQGMDAGGDAEEMVRVGVMRNGELIEVLIPRGVLRNVETATHSVNPTL